MNVLYLCHRIPYPPNKGEKIRAFHQIRALAQHHNVDLFALGDGDDNEDGRRALSEFCREVKVFKLNLFAGRLRCLPVLLTDVPLTLPCFYSGVFREAVDEAIRSRSYDRLFLYSSTMAQYVSDDVQVPVVMDLVDVDSDKWKQYQRYSHFPMSAIYRREACCLRAYERRVCRHAGLTLVTTEREASLVNEFCPEANVRVVRNGVDSRYFTREAEATDDAPPTVVFTGDMGYFANVQAVTYFATDVLPIIRHSLPNARFLIVGRNPTSRVRDLRRFEGIEVTGTVPDVRTYLQRARVSVAPFSISAGIPNKILEAMAFGLPVVGTKCAIQGLSPTTASAIEVAESAKQFADKTLRLLTNQDLARVRGADCRNRVVTEYRWENTMEAMVDLITHPLRSRKSAMR